MMILLVLLTVVCLTSAGCLAVAILNLALGDGHMMEPEIRLINWCGPPFLTSALALYMLTTTI